MKQDNRHSYAPPRGVGSRQCRARAKRPSLKWSMACAHLIIILVLFCLHVQAATSQGGQSLRVTGVVLDQMKSPIPQAQVSLYHASTLIHQVITGDDGQFIFEGVIAGDITLLVRARGFAQSEQRWRAIKSEPPALVFVLSPASLAEQVMVTATRTETRLGETAASVVVLTTEELSTTAAVTLDDALRQVPGFQLFRRSGSRNANPTSQGVSLRGVGASGASRAVVLSDGVPLNDPFGGWITWGRVPRASINRVEVLRGGASSLYGSDALGGVINIMTREPTSLALSLEASYGNQQTPNATLFAGMRKGRWRANLSSEMLSTDGYILVADDERGRVDTPAGSHHSAFDFKLERELGKAATVFARAAYFGEARTNGTPLQTNRTHIRQWSAGGDWQSSRLGNFTARAYGGTQVFDQNFSAVAADRNSETLTRVQRVPVQDAGLSLQWSRAFGARHTWLAGFEGREVRGVSDEIVFTQGRPASLVGAGGRERTFGLYAEDIFRLTSHLTLTGGLRLDRWRNYRALSANRALRQNAAATVTPFPDRIETAFSPQLSALYRVNEHVSLNASAYRAFRQPTLNELYRSFRVGDVLTLANERLSAERLTGGEAGVNLTPQGGRLSVRGTLFWTEISRPIANVTLNVAPTLITRQRQNLGRTRSRGIEIESEARLHEHWTISGGYLFADAVVLKFPANTALEGLLIPQVARHQLTFQTRYVNPKLITVGLQGRLMSAQFDDDQNRFPLNRAFTLDAFASRQLTHQVELFLAAENLLNQRYQIGRTPVTTLGSPLLLRMGLRLNLGAR
jgi:outer membrane receptor protein involved in Fe transport